MTTLVPGFTRHLLSPDLLDAAAHPTASFTSTSVAVTGTSARITGNLTLKGVTRPVVLDAKFHGAGGHPMSKKLNIGFTAKTTILRSDFGINYSPAVGDEIDLQINAAFEKLA